MANSAEILALFDEDQRKHVEFPGLRREIADHVIRHVDLSDTPQGLITFSDLNEESADRVIREQMDYFSRLGQGFEWKLYDYDRPANLRDRLRALGFQIEEAESIMVLDLTRASKKLWDVQWPEVQRIDDIERIADVLSVENRVWGEDFSGLGDYLRNALQGVPDRVSIYVAYADGQPVSAAWVLFSPHGQFGSLWGGSTLIDYRKRGIYSSLLAVRAREARDRGVRFLTVDASEMSRPILEKQGFEKIAVSYPCKWTLPA